ncbi:MAG TPA: adenylate/guanylate cyclase domain-containing protein [Candidatus Limnocylindrales bacterium]|nr:adenylate/guanylate cyclase domain-containing protein [Candidatus Limnocylindrales bacterium]
MTASEPAAASTLPTGTVTFLFTDIEGSTKRVAAMGDEAYGRLLADEGRLVLDAVRAEGGVPFGSEGDAHFAAFSSAADAVRAAVRAQQALAAHDWDGEPVRVRMGLHAGVARVVEGDYVGFEVHRAARIAACAHGGQLVVSEAVKALAADPGDGIAFRDLGEHRLKDLAAPERVYQVTAPGLDAEFPPLRSLDATPNNLPAQLTSFVGRAEVADAVALLDHTRLLTLTGPGGTGKTRLSLAVAVEIAHRFPGGAWFVPLAAIRDPDLVASAIGGTLGVLSATTEPLVRVTEYLRDRRALLVLDNFEQVVAGAPVVGDILRAAPGVVVIASSRAPLRVAGEQEFPVPPLAVPAAGVVDPEVIGASEAVRLFLERARAVRPGFVLTAENAPRIAEIVRRLDGLPLAIELAAARVRVLTPTAIAERLHDRLALLAAGGRDLPERQRTLRGAIDWSYELLDDDDRLLFARLGVFAGGADLETAERLLALPGDERALPVLDGLERLAEQSLIRIAADDHDDVRFTMLETIREYAVDRLAASGSLPELRERHAEAFLALVRTAAGDESGTTDRGSWLDRVEDDHDNIRAALEWWIERGDCEAASALVFASWRFWQMRGHIAEGRARCDAVLRLAGWADADPMARLQVLEAAGGLAYWAADLGAANRHYSEAVSVARAIGDDAALANALYNNFFATREGGTMADWGDSLAYEGKPLLDEALALWERLGDEDGIAKANWGLAEHHAYRGENAEAVAAATRALEIFERSGSSFWIAWTRFTRGFAHAAAGDVAPAASDLVVALREFRATGDVSGIALLLSSVSTALLMTGRPLDAYAIGGAAARAVAESGTHLANLWPGAIFAVPDLDTTDPVLREAIARGRAWPRDEAVDRAVDLLDRVAAGTIEAEPGDPSAG